MQPRNRESTFRLDSISGLAWPQRDDSLEAYSGDADPEREREARVVPQPEQDGLAFGFDMAFRRALRAVEIPPAKGEGEGHESEGGGGEGEAPRFLTLNSAHYAGDELTQQDQCEQAESFREVRRVWRKFHAVLHGDSQ